MQHLEWKLSYTHTIQSYMSNDSGAILETSRRQWVCVGVLDMICIHTYHTELHEH